MRLVFDKEGNGLYDTVDKIWCICAEDMDTGKKYEWTIENSQGTPSYNPLQNATELIGHNIINYDLPVLKKIWGWEPNENTKITDTLVMSRLANPDRPKPLNYAGKGGPHSLEAWGDRVGKGKLEHEDWSVFSADMLRRCRQDVEINRIVYHTISAELEDFSQDSIDLEHEIARIITEQEHHGIRFDYDTAQRYCQELTDRIDAIDEHVVPLLPKELEKIGTTVTNPFKKNGELRKQVTDYMVKYEIEHFDVGGPFTRVMFKDFNVGNAEKVKDYLLDNGWVPDKWNYSQTTGERTSPKLEGEFRGVDGELPRKIKERITWRHRRSQIEGWINNARFNADDNCYTLNAGADPCGTPTGRMRHKGIVNLPRATTDKETGELVWDTEKQSSVFGTQIRSLFIPREGYVIVGHDIAGLELRMLAHYLDDAEFTKQILEGDIHAFNQEKAGLPTRNDAKTFIFALIYGAGDPKIGSIINGTDADGKQIKEDYFTALPKLKVFINKVKRAAGKQGYLRGLDGRKLIMRKDEHGRVNRNKAVNTLIQAAGAIINKKGCEILWKKVKEHGIDAHKILDMHDEGQAEVRNDPKVIELYSKLAVQSVIEAGEYYNLNIPLDAEAKVGMSLAETH